MPVEVYDNNPGLVAHLERTYSGLVLIYAGFRGENRQYPHAARHGLDVALEIAKRDPRPTIIIFGFIPMMEWRSDTRIFELRVTDRVHFIDAPLDNFRVENAWRDDHGKDPVPNKAPWLPKNSLPNPRTQRGTTKNP